MWILGSLVARSGIAKDPKLVIAFNRISLKLKYPGPARDEGMDDPGQGRGIRPLYPDRHPDCIPAPGANDPPKAVMAAKYYDLHRGATPGIMVGKCPFHAQ